MTRAARQAADRPEIAAIVRGDHGDPFSVLGLHRQGGDGALVARTFQPQASGVAIVDLGSGRATPLNRIHPEGFFEGVVGRGAPFAYKLRVTADGGEADLDDPYRFPPLLGEMDVYLLAEGTHLHAYDVLGAHPRRLEGVDGVAFAVWAPNARRVSIVGPFNNWDGRRHPMRLRHECGIWELFVPGLAPGALYKYEIRAPSGELVPLKADPFAFGAEQPPATASMVCDLERYVWRDDDWRARRAQTGDRHAPICIYEVHLGSWKRRLHEGGRYLSYDELANELVPYVRDLGFTHIELLPVSEYPFDGSWGYQPIGLFAPTSRFGSPDGFRGFVDRCHQAGIGVIADWVAGHFPTDAHGLGRFDGTALYEHEDPRQGMHRDWDTLIYNYGRREVANYLLANALFWIDRYHIDGLRVDAVASMLYLDYSRQAGDWIPNRYGGRENLEAIDFMRRMNEAVYGRGAGAVTVAEESTAWPMVSRPTHLGGLGFGYKWNMGWMHDTLQYMSKDPIHRRHHQDLLTFGLLYAFSENFVLPLSHDEVVHGKGSLYGKMPGDRWQKLANLRAYYAFMYTMPGKKLLFMGAELAQEREWNHDRGLDWQLLDDPMNRGIQTLVRDLNGLYRGTPALHELDCEQAGFEWIDCNDAEHSIVSYLRRGHDPDRVAAIICNFTPVLRHNYRIGVPRGGFYRERLNTDAAVYGGSDVGNGGGVMAAAEPWHGRPFSISLTLPPLATLVFLSEEGR